MAEEDLIKQEQYLTESVEILQNILKQQAIYIEQIIVALGELGIILFIYLFNYLFLYTYIYTYYMYIF